MDTTYTVTTPREKRQNVPWIFNFLNLANDHVWWVHPSDRILQCTVIVIPPPWNFPPLIDFISHFSAWWLSCYEARGTCCRYSCGYSGLCVWESVRVSMSVCVCVCVCVNDSYVLCSWVMFWQQIAIIKAGLERQTWYVQGVCVCVCWCLSWSRETNLVRRRSCTGREIARDRETGAPTRLANQDLECWRNVSTLDSLFRASMSLTKGSGFSV